MKTFRNFVLSFTIICFTVFVSCTDVVDPTFTEAQDKIILYYPGEASPGSLITVKAALTGTSDYQTLVNWYADDYPFPQTLRDKDIIGPRVEASYLFTFPSLPEQANYYIRCSIRKDDGTVFEKTIKIESTK